MPKPKRKPKVQVKAHKTVLGSDDEELYNDLKQPNSKSSEYYFDEVDEFHSQKDKILLDGGEKLSYGDTSSEEEEVMAFDNDHEEEDSDEDYEDEHTRKLRKDEMASDIEDNEEEGLPSVKAWGKKKSLYYNTDFVDQDFGRGYKQEDAELAEAEEMEALAMQKRLVEEIDEADFGLESFVKKIDQTDKKEVKMEEKVMKDLSKMSKNEKLDLLKKESPELLELINDFENKLTELRDKFEPLITLVKDGGIPPGPGADYVLTKYQLILHYCTNIGFYFILKSRGTSVKNHPVIKRLLTYRKLFQQLETVDNNLNEEISTVLEKLKNGEEIRPLTIDSEAQVTQTLKKRIKHSSPAKTSSTKFEEEEKAQNKNKKIKRFETEDEKEILSMYSQSKRIQKVTDDESEELLSEDLDENDYNDMEVGEENNFNEDNDKRGITYQIAKNKGLTAYRKKEYRNPRVKHRMKYRKAKIRRRGQVREVRKELQRYGGELSGIRIGVKKGIKLK